MSTSLRAWRASSGPAPRATCPSGEPEASTTEATTEMGPQMLDMPKSKFYVDGQDLAPVDIENQRNFHCLYPLETYKVVCLILSINRVEGFASVYLSFFSGDI